MIRSMRRGRTIIRMAIDGKLSDMSDRLCS
jgi:hypothetical protein